MRLLSCCSQRYEMSFSSQPGHENEVTKDSIRSGIEKFGFYQIVTFAFISIPIILSAMYMFSFIFTTGEVKYRCLVPECEHPENATFDNDSPWINFSAPKVKGIISGCVRYMVVNNHSDSCSTTSFTNVTSECDSWVYNPNEHTILDEWDLTCDSNRWKLTLVGTMRSTGVFTGLMFAGYISDRYGRRTLLTLTTFLAGVSGLIHSFSVNYWMFLAFEFLDAVMMAGIYNAGFILGIEMIGARNRVFGGVLLFSMFSMGMILLGLIASWLRSWRVHLRVVYAPGLLAIFLPLLVPESIRWLMLKGKTDEVEKIYRKIARMNNLQVTDEAINVFKELNMADKMKSELLISDKRKPIVQVLRSSVILIRLSACSFCWITNTFVYYGLSLNSVTFAGDKYINYILVAMVDIPSFFFTWLLTDRIGRKSMLSGAFLLSGMFCLAIQFVPTGTWSYGPILLYMAGKICITAAFSITYVYTAEMFPTMLRHSLLGFCSMIGRIGSILAPQMPLLAQIMPSLPLILFGSMAIIAGILSLIFPETLGTKLPDTVWEAENIGRVKSNETREIPDLKSDAKTP